MRSKKGFTLIELLVVIAIIGLLSSVVLASLNTARSKAADAAIKSSLETVRSQAAIFYDSHLDANDLVSENNYGDGQTATLSNQCSTMNGTTMFYLDSKINNSITVAKSYNGNTTANSAKCASFPVNASVDNEAQSWAVAVMLKTNQTRSWCVDSSGASKEVAAIGTAAFVQGPTAVNCI